MASSDRPFLIPVDCYAGMFGEPADMLTGWGREADVLPTPTPVPDYAAFNAAQHETFGRVWAEGTELLKKHGRSYAAVAAAQHETLTRAMAEGTARLNLHKQNRDS